MPSSFFHKSCTNTHHPPERQYNNTTAPKNLLYNHPRPQLTMSYFEYYHRCGAFSHSEPSSTGKCFPARSLPTIECLQLDKNPVLDTPCSNIWCKVCYPPPSSPPPPPPPPPPQQPLKRKSPVGNSWKPQSDHSHCFIPRKRRGAVDGGRAIENMGSMRDALSDV